MLQQTKCLDPFAAGVIPSSASEADTGSAPATYVPTSRLHLTSTMENLRAGCVADPTTNDSQYNIEDRMSAKKKIATDDEMVNASTTNVAGLPLASEAKPQLSTQLDPILEAHSELSPRLHTARIALMSHIGCPFT